MAGGLYEETLFLETTAVGYVCCVYSPVIFRFTIGFVNTLSTCHYLRLSAMAGVRGGSWGEGAAGH